MQPSSKARDTLDNNKIVEIKGENDIDFKRRSTVLIKDTFNFNNTYNSEYNNAKYLYEVELLVLNDLRGKNSVVNTEKFCSFLIKEHDKKVNKKYDLDINIRDLYPIDIHTNNKPKENVDRFYQFNKFILSINNIISRRVTKKEIVYKKDKSRSILSVQISKSDYLKVFVLEHIKQYDYNNSFKTISKGNCKPLKKLMIIKNDSDLKYLFDVIKKYLKKMF